GPLPRDLAIVGHDRSVPRAAASPCRLRALNRRRDQSLGFCTSMTQTSLCWAGAVYTIRLPWIPHPPRDGLGPAPLNVRSNRGASPFKGTCQNVASPSWLVLRA